MSLCTSCYWNTVNDFFEPIVTVVNGQAKTTNECVNDVRGYPKMEYCSHYEAAHRMDEE